MSGLGQTRHGIQGILGQGKKCRIGRWKKINKKNPRQTRQGEQIWKPEEVGRGVGDQRKRKEGCMEQDWESQGSQLGQETGGAKELGEGRRGCRAGVVPTWEAHG